MKMKAHAGLPATVLIFTVAVNAAVFADVITSEYISSTNFKFQIDDMPDFDQLRDTLGADANGDPGGMYCSPTSQTNLLGYITTHGFEDVGPREADWENEEDYGVVTAIISNQASLSSTQPLNGTSSGGAFDALVYFLNARAPGVFSVTSNSATNTTGPTLRSIVENNVNGAISMFGYGIYDSLGEDEFGRLVLDRNGGHAVTFAQGFCLGNDQEIGYNDPDDSTITSTQSNFSLDQYDVESTHFVRSDTLSNAWQLGSRTGSRIMRGATRYRIIDSVIHIRPRGCYSWDSSENQFTIEWAGTLDGYNPTSLLSGPVAGNLTDIDLGPLGNSIWYADEQTGQPWRIELANGNATELVHPHEVLQLEFARDYSLIYLGKQQISRVHPYAEPGANMPQPQTAFLPWHRGYIAMSIDHMTNTCWFADEQAVFRITASLDGDPNQVQMPDQWPQGLDIMDLAVTGIPDMPISILGQDGRVMLCGVSESGQLIMKDVIWTDGTISSVQFNDERDLVGYSEQGIQLHRNVDGDWSMLDDHPFKGRVFSGRAVMAMSRSNFDPQMHTGEKWRHVRDVVGVAGDLNEDGVVDIDDLLKLLGNFGNSGDGDFDADGIVSIDDLLHLLGLWTT